jgi:hypothetical protein
MSAPNSVTLNAGSGGSKVGTIQDSASDEHALVVVEYWNGSGDPVVVGTSNPLPVTASSLPLPSGAALDTSVNGILVAQGSTTAGEKGPLVQAAVTTSGPTYTSAQTAPLSLDTSGNLRVNVVTGGGSGGTSTADASTFTRGTTLETPVAGIASSSATGLTVGKTSVVSVDATDNGLWAHVTNGIASGTAGSASANVVSVQGIASMTPVQVQVLAEPTGGATRSSVICPTTPAVQTVKSSGGNLLMLVATNTSGSVAYLHFYDVSGSITLGTTSATDVYPIPANTSGAGIAVPIPTCGLKFTNQIAYAVTGAVGATDNSAIAGSTVVVVNLAYN